MDKRVCSVCGDTKNVAKIVNTENKNYVNKDLCSKHYSQIRLKKEITDETPSTVGKRRICSYCGSDKKVRIMKATKKGFCEKHYGQMKRNGEISERTIYDRNELVIYPDYAEIIIYNKKCEEVARTMIDICDIEKVCQIKWRLSTWGYVEGKRKGQQKSIMIQRLIISEANSNEIIDHIDRNPLNNRRYNLRIVNKSTNSLNIGLKSNNTSGVTGVSYSKNHKKWIARININKHSIILGRSSNFEEAVKLRLKGELKYCGEHSPQKHLFKQYEIKTEMEIE